MKDITIAKSIIGVINATINTMCIGIGMVPMIFYFILFHPENFYTFLAGMIVIAAISIVTFAISYVNLKPFIWKRILNKIR